MKIISALFLFFTLYIPALSAQTQQYETIINSMIEAYGGETNLVQLNRYDQVWHIETKTSDTNGTDRRSVRLPGFLKTELIYPHKTEVRTLDGETGTKQFGTESIQVRGPMLDAMKAQLYRLYHPLMLKERISDITVTENADHYILFLNTSGPSAEYFVSKQTHLIDKVIGRLRMGMQQMEFITLYSDYQLRNGVMVPHTEVKYAANINTAIMRLKEMKFIP